MPIISAHKPIHKGQQWWCGELDCTDCSSGKWPQPPVLFALFPLLPLWLNHFWIEFKIESYQIDQGTTREERQWCLTNNSHGFAWIQLHTKFMIVSAQVGWLAGRTQKFVLCIVFVSKANKPNESSNFLFNLQTQVVVWVSLHFFLCREERERQATSMRPSSSCMLACLQLRVEDKSWRSSLSTMNLNGCDVTLVMMVNGTTTTSEPRSRVPGYSYSNAMITTTTTTAMVLACPKPKLMLRRLGLTRKLWRKKIWRRRKSKISSCSCPPHPPPSWTEKNPIIAHNRCK